jgi:hypothetical protein
MTTAALIVAGAFLANLSIAGAQEKPPCERFAWPLDQEKAWFSGGLETLHSGAILDKLGDGAFAVELAPAASVAYLKPPESPPKNDQPNGAMVTVGEVTAAGHYQVTLSDEAWIDMIQSGTYAPSTEHSGVKGCEGLRKSVRFVLIKGQLAIQLSGAPTSILRVAIRHLD